MKNIDEIEKEILKYWKENNIFEKSLKKDSPKGEYVFYDGPPFATGTPHYGHIVANTMKDVIPRYKTMKGYYVERKWGWDCHGLPIENIVEKELGFKRKKDIENLGVEKFNQACYSKVLTYTDEWEKVIERLARWVDMKNPYKTMDLSYMESVWWVFKQLWDKNLIYEGFKSMHICPRCETTLSQQEVSENYKDIKDISVVVKLKLKDEPKTYILAWTTTPWTLPGNVALAVGEGIDYVKLTAKKINGKLPNNINFKEGETIILSKESFEDAFMGAKYGDDFVGGKFGIIGPSIKSTNHKEFEFSIDFINCKKFKGKELLNKKYIPLFPYYLDKEFENKENIYKIVGGDFVSTEEGTGIVHIAPAFGEDDMILGQKENLPMIQNVGIDGYFSNEVEDFKGMNVKPIEDSKKTDRKIVEYLKEKDLVFKEEEFEHSYPHCWRCETPLINYATSSWFVKISSIKERMIELNKKINWFPKHIKEGRFGKWLEGARDWAISRQRFWASVMPIWKCSKCSEINVFGSVKELEEKSKEKISDIHKNVVDKIQFPCEKCKGEMKRIPDVLDTWFDSGSMPFAQNHYPFENKEKFEKNFPAQFIAEGIDQTRAWFYYLHVIAVSLMDNISFENVIVNGIVLAEDGKKMSKSLQNYTDPSIIMKQYGADALRLYLLSSPVVSAENFNFSDNGVKENYQKNVLLLQNILKFYNLYKLEKPEKEFKSDNPLDIWLVSKLELLNKDVSDYLEQYDLSHATRKFSQFIDDFSTWWLRLSRQRFKDSQSSDYDNGIKTFSFVLFHLSKILAPFAPYISEYIYKEIKGGKESVHLEDWPDKIIKIDEDILKKMELTRKAVEIGLALRGEKEIKIRQPLNKIYLKDKEIFENIFIDLVKQELNIKEIELGKENKLDTEITEELKQEGLLRELARKVNYLRKEQGFSIEDKDIKLEYETKSEELKKIFIKFNQQLKEMTLCSDISEKKGIKEEELDISGEKVKIRVVKG